MLRPKTAAVLACLLARAGEVASKAELLAAVWPDGFVGEETLSTCISELRTALGDDAKQPRFIATEHRRGYRFLATVSSTPPVEAVSDRRQRTPFVGRKSELAILEDCWSRAFRGERQLVFVAAPAGVGKTALVDAFVERLRADEQAVLIGRGQCVEQFGEGEAYLPVLDALYGMGHGPDGTEVRDLLRSLAPTWLLQLPGLFDPADLETLRVLTLGASSERMLREVADVLVALSERRPVVVVCEDVHLGDRSTAELLAYLGRRRDPARLLVVCTMRPADTLTRSHPLRHVVHDLRARRLCRYLALEPLSRSMVADYLGERLARRSSDALIDDVFMRTNGNALFVTTLIDYLEDRDLLIEGDDGLVSRQPLADIGTPDSLRSFIERQLEELATDDRRLVEVAAVAGVEFATAAVLAGTRDDHPDRSAIEVEDRLAQLVRDVGLLRAAGSSSWPDGTLTSNFRFHHSLYQESLYQAVPPGRRASIHRDIGERLAAAYGDGTDEIAAQLAMHFERGHDDARAVRYLAVAAESALRRAAHRDGLEYATRALRLLDRLDDSEIDATVELRLCMTQTVALGTLQGFGAAGVDRAFLRARAVCARIDDPTVLAPVLYGLWMFSLNQRSIGGAFEFSAELAELARRQPDPVLELQAQHVAGFNAWVAGQPLEALPFLERGIALYDRVAHRHIALTYGEDPAVGCHRTAAIVSWTLGYPDRARDHAGEAIRLAEELGYTNDIAQAHSFAICVHVLCRDLDRAGEHCEALLRLSSRFGLALFAAIGRTYQGWVIAQQGDLVRGVAQMREGLDDFAGSFFQAGIHWLTEPLAEALVELGEPAAALETADQALDNARQSGQVWFEAEHMRLRGAALLAADAASSAAASRETEAERALLEAHAIARRQNARSLELRAATSLAELWHRRGDTDRARELLAGAYGWFTEGHDTADLVTARRVLDQLGEPPQKVNGHAGESTVTG